MYKENNQANKIFNSFMSNNFQASNSSSDVVNTNIMADLSKMTIEDLYKAVEAEEREADMADSSIEEVTINTSSVKKEETSLPEQKELSINPVLIEKPEPVEIAPVEKQEEETIFNTIPEETPKLEPTKEEEPITKTEEEPSVESVFNTMPKIDIPPQVFQNQIEQTTNFAPYTDKLKEIESLINQKPQQVKKELPQQANQKIFKEMHIINNPKSSFGEAIKSIRTNLQFSAVDKEKKVILITSPQPSDGKSTISSNLAGAYAQDDKKVLIIDCDLRKGRQKEIFHVSSKSLGYTNMILNYIDDEENYNIDDYIVKSGIDNIDLVPNGPIPPNPIELLASEKNSELISKLKEMYDIVILDCPPVLGLSDTLIMTKYSDANLVVVSKGKTKVEFLAEVKKSFEKANSSITGVIINKVKQQHNSYYGYYGSN